MTKTIIFGGNDNHCKEALKGLDMDDTVDFGEMFSKYGLVLLMPETSESELVDLSKDLPTDTHLVEYVDTESVSHVDAVRAYNKADIFDAYHDAGLHVEEIRSGFGSIKPKLFNDSKKAS